MSSVEFGGSEYQSSGTDPPSTDWASTQSTQAFALQSLPNFSPPPPFRLPRLSPVAHQHKSQSPVKPSRSEARRRELEIDNARFLDELVRRGNEYVLQSLPARDSSFIPFALQLTNRFRISCKITLLSSPMRRSIFHLAFEGQS